MIEFQEGRVSALEFNGLTEKVGWGAREEALVEEALAHTLYGVCAYEGGKLVGYGRLIGDGTIFLYVQDVMVDPQYQGQGIGSGIVKRLVGQIEKCKSASPDLRAYLGASPGRESFYKRFGFKTRSEMGLGEGMVYM